MKNKLLCILSILFMFIPVFVNAEADIKSTSIIGNNSVSVGDEVTQDVYINFNGVKTNDAKSVGLWFVSFELIFDESALELVEVETPDWLSYAAKSGSSWAVVSFLYDDLTPSNKCIDGETFCGSYNIKLKFKALKETTTEIILGEIAATASDMYEDNELEITGTSNSSKKITINKKETTNNKVDRPNNDNKEDKKENNNEEQQEITPVAKSSNRYLEKLEIEGYEIDFNKYTNDYEIIIKEDKQDEKLNITAVPEHEQAKVTIIGADNFSKYNNKVEIVVVSENGMKNTYTIKIKISMNEEDLDKELTKEQEKNEFKLTDKHLIIGGIVLGALLLIIIVRFIVVKINDRKIDKALDDL